jgi:hypothetical protein
LHVPWQNVAWAAGQGARIEDRDARGHRITLVQADPDQLFQVWIVLYSHPASGPPHPKRIQVSAALRAQLGRPAAGVVEERA